MSEVGAALGAVDTVTLAGREFRLADTIGLAPMIRFAMAARKGVDSNDVEGLAALGDMIEQCIHPDEVDAFWLHATANRCDGDALLEVVTDAMTTITGRPTSRPSVSSDGPQTTSGSSKDGSSSVVPFEERARALGMVPIDELSSVG